MDSWVGNYNNSPHPHEREQQLTGRELQILRQLSEGNHLSAIGATLGIHRATVRRHVENFRIKLGAKNREQAVAVAFRRGILT